MQARGNLRVFQCEDGFDQSRNTGRGVEVTDMPWFEALVRYKQAAASALIIKNNRKIPQPGVDIDRMVVALPKLLSWADDLLS